MNGIDTCALCGENEKPVIVVGDERRTYLAACALCLCRLFDRLTGYKMEKMYNQYERLRAFHARRKVAVARGWTGPRKGMRFDEVLPDAPEST